jgi:hypothetical protein
MPIVAEYAVSTVPVGRVGVVISKEFVDGFTVTTACFVVSL